MAARCRQSEASGDRTNTRRTLRPEALLLLPSIAPDYRDQADVLVHKDLRLAFDGNRYCVPPRYVGRRLTVKADSPALTIYDQQQEVPARSPKKWGTRHR
jgi:hypothetical protein